MIFITGDTHGHVDFKKLLALREKNLSFEDYLIILGDAAIVWSIGELDYYKNLYRSLGCTILYIDGNHENFELLNTFPLVEFKNALMHQIDEHIFHILRGEILILENKKFLCIGGATSIDKLYRIPYVSWWPEEEINQHDIDNALNNLAKYDDKVDYVLTHCIDTKTVIKAFGFRRDICTDQLMFVDKVVSYKHWFCGHYHFDRQIDKNKTCLFQNIVEII